MELEESFNEEELSLDGVMVGDVIDWILVIFGGLGLKYVWWRMIG